MPTSMTLFFRETGALSSFKLLAGCSCAFIDGSGVWTAVSDPLLAILPWELGGLGDWM